MKSTINKSSPNYGEIIAPFPTSGNPLDELPEEALKELKHYTEFLYNKCKGWKPGSSTITLKNLLSAGFWFCVEFDKFRFFDIPIVGIIADAIFMAGAREK